VVRVEGYGLVFYNFPGYSLEQFVLFAARTGFRYAEIPIQYLWNEKDPSDYAEARASEVGSLLRRHGLVPSAVSAGNDFLQPDDRALEAQIERLRRVLRLARLAGTDLVRVDGGWPKPSVPAERERYFSLIVEGLRGVMPFAEAEGYTLALDNHGVVTNDADFQVRIFEAVASPRLGANLDTMNYRWAGHDLATVARFYHVIAPWVRHVHLKDGRGSQREYRGTALGEGEIDLLAAVRELQAVGYRGPWCVEFEGDRSQAEEGYRKGLEWLRAHLGG
jgi:sugar phosphate isomerase/epimerase